MKHITGGVTAAKGFEAAGAEARVKYQNRKDMAMVFSRTPCRAAGVFTSNVVKAAPVVWDREIVENEGCGPCGGGQFRNRQRMYGRAGKTVLQTDRAGCGRSAWDPGGLPSWWPPRA